jgi:putative DNA primase/helicase
VNQDLDLTPDEVTQLAAIAGFQLDASDQDLASINPQVWMAIGEFNNPPTIFRFGEMIVRLESADDESRVLLAPMTPDRMRYLLARAINWYRIDKKTSERRSAFPPRQVVLDVLATPTAPLPRLLSITHCPNFNRCGQLNQAPGYSPQTQTYYAPTTGFEVPQVTSHPSHQEVQDAKAIILEVIEDFPFTGNAERAHAVALGFLLFIRDMIDGPTPLHIIEKPAPGMGGTLLAKALTYPAVANNGSIITEAKSDEEWRKRITSVLKRGPAAIIIDNINRELSSASLSSVLTQTSWEDRILGQSDTIRLPNQSVWIVTGNNPSFSHEIARRSIRIRLDARMDRAGVPQTTSREMDC